MLVVRGVALGSGEGRDESGWDVCGAVRGGASLSVLGGGKGEASWAGVSVG